MFRLGSAPNIWPRPGFVASPRGWRHPAPLGERRENPKTLCRGEPAQERLPFLKKKKKKIRSKVNFDLIPFFLQPSSCSASFGRGRALSDRSGGEQRALKARRERGMSGLVAADGFQVGFVAGLGCNLGP